MGGHWDIQGNNDESLIEEKVLVSQSCLTSLCDPQGLWPATLLCPWNSSGKSTGVGGHSLLQQIFLTQVSNPGLLHCRWFLYRLNHQGRSH